MKPRRRKRRLHPDTQQLIKQIFFGVLIFLLVAGLVTGIWYGTRAAGVTITAVTIEGGETISHDDLHDLVQSELEGTYLRLVPRRFAFMYPKDDIFSALATVPRIKDIKLQRVGGTELKVLFSEFKAEALWCGGSDDCVFLDDTGYAFATAPRLEGGSFMRFYSESIPRVGTSVVAPSEYQALADFTDALLEVGYVTEAIEVTSAQDAYLTLTSGGELRISLLQEAADTLQYLATVLESDDFSGLATDEFQYIDLRFGNKVFVNRAPEEVATSSEESLVEFSIEPEAVEIEESTQDSGSINTSTEQVGTTT